jgi:hypothetical protein
MSNWIECYNPSNNAWHHVSRVPGLIENHILKGFSMAVRRGSIFVIGSRLCHKMAVGDNDNPNDIVEVDLEVLSSVLRYDIGDDAWFKCAPLSTPRFDFACTVCDDKIYVAGGQCALASAKGVSSAEVYDPGLYLTMAPIGTNLYFLAGYRMPAPAGEISGMKSVVTCPRFQHDLKWG